MDYYLHLVRHDDTCELHGPMTVAQMHALKDDLLAPTFSQESHPTDVCMYTTGIKAHQIDQVCKKHKGDVR